ncbi:TetR family transcriptional regulator [Actinoplanes sp. ATCC 53533]|uniref:TetR/AcrR family transcriptional regulator n=1 Tax=Actinoplanes sp. ATCC 53533 TaxID=1288362 RepID=UPI000F772DAC|nr:TetR/AcrR family transcriptional regulator [Actinoplanes sp. ATCC 53533]RSM74887.1 TetR family transcriptional regulator [Actinoplanes sp. ATCC 53533]
MAEKMPPAQRRRGTALEDVLLEAAWTELQRTGYAEFTIDAVARAARTSRAVLYRRWPHRAALVLAALRAHVTPVAEDVPDTGSLGGDVIAVLSTLAGRADVGGLDVLVGLLSELDEVPESLTTTVPDVLRQVLARAAARGEIGRGDIPATVLELPVFLLRYDMVVNRRTPSGERLTEIVDDLFLPLVQRYASA